MPGDAEPVARRADIAQGFIDKSGAWFSLDGERIGQGRDRACEWLRAHPDAQAALRDKLLEAMKQRRDVLADGRGGHDAEGDAVEAAA